MPIDRITDVSYTKTSSKDFVIRDRYPSLLQIFIIFLSVVLVGTSVVLASGDKTALISILFILGGATSWYVMILIQRSRDQLLATEFQNALFASALGMNHKFCLIARRDGTIIYHDRAFQDMFPEFIRQPGRNVELFLDFGKVSPADKDRIFKAVDVGNFQKVVFDVRGTDGRTQKIIMSIEPILRPSGFILMRGREFVEARAADGAPSTGAHSSPFNHSTMNLFAGVMDTMGMGVYMASSQGQINYINPALVALLGYTPQDMAGGGISLQTLLHGTGDDNAFEPRSFEGELVLTKKSGALIKCYVHQSAIYDDQQGVIGCTGLVQHLADGADAKKKNW